MLAVAVGLSLVAGCDASVESASEGPSTSAPSTEALADPDAGPVAPPVRHPATARPIYFVLPDRFENGDPSNDTGGLDGGPLVTGYLPEDTGFHHGGDLVGLTERLPYLAELGIGAIWITPPFTNRYVQGDGTVEGSSSGYHGYWQIDWSRIDPHLGSDDDMRAFIDAAHALDIDVYFDIVVNHTGDVIRLSESAPVYFSTSARPYLDAEGREFDPAAVAGTDEFPALDPETSFPYVPSFSTPEDATVKSPEWLNDVTLYHNRGDSTFQGESSLYGDFFGLDDLFTEHPRVVEGMTELHVDVLRRFDVDGFRVDTMKHVNIEFWEHFAPRIREAAAELGRPDFFFFGEVFSTDAILASSHTVVGVPATADFIVADALERYVAQGGSGEQMAAAFDDDDWFTDADSDASMQVVFFGNHDMGRMGFQVDRGSPGADDDALLRRMQLGFDLLFTMRGIPVVYYGDEQGFVGDGGDQLARQSMFPSVTPAYVDDDQIGTDATPADDNFDPTHPLYRHVADLAALRASTPALVTGAHVVHETSGPLLAFSRIDRGERVEHVVVANNATLEVPARFRALSPDTTFEIVRGGEGTVISDASGELKVDVAPLSSVLLRATTPLAPPDAAPTIGLVRPDEGAELPTFRYRIEAELGDRRYAEVTFAVAVDGGEPVVIGTDDAAPYRVYWDNRALPDGATVEIVATVDDGSGRLRSDRRTVTLGTRR